METARKSLAQSSQAIRRSTVPVRPASGKDLDLRSRPRRVSFPDKTFPPSQARASVSNKDTFQVLPNSSHDGKGKSVWHPPWTPTSQPPLDSGCKTSSGCTLCHACGEPDPAVVLKAIQKLARSKSNVYDQLNIDRLTEACYETMTTPESQTERRPARTIGVFGAPLHESSEYASISALFNGREIHLPTVVFNCVEELYRTGIYQPDLFRTLPSRKRLSELIRIFNSPDPGHSYKVCNRNRRSKVAEYNATLLYLESTQDICALLTDYLYSLPEPIVPSYISDAIWESSGLKQEARGNYDFELGNSTKLPVEQSQLRQGAPSLVRTYTDESEAMRIKVVQLLLCLLPSPNFSLLVYLLAFFSHVAMMRDVNGASTQELGRLFGKCIFGSGEQSQLPRGSQSRTNNTRDGKIMCWFLTRWGALSNGLFDVMEACSTNQLPTTHRVRGNLTPPLHSPASKSLKNPENKHGHHLSNHAPFTPQYVPNSCSANFAESNCHSKEREELADILEGQRGLSRKNRLSRERQNEDTCEPEEPLLPTTSASMSRATSAYSAPANERLLDVTFPALFDNFHFFDNTTSEELDDVHRSCKPVVEHQEDYLIESCDEELFRVQAKIRDLELQLAKRDAMVAQAIEVMFRAKRRIDEIDDRLRGLAMGLHRRQNLMTVFPSGSGLSGDAKVWKERFERTLMEYRDAYEEVMALRELMSAEL